MKKTVIIFVISALLLYFGYGCYWYFVYEKNNVIFLVTNTSREKVFIEISIDDNKVLSDSLDAFTSLLENVIPGIHTITVKVDSVESKSLMFIPIKWILIDYNSPNYFSDNQILISSRFFRPRIE